MNKEDLDKTPIASIISIDYKLNMICIDLYVHTFRHTHTIMELFCTPFVGTNSLVWVNRRYTNRIVFMKNSSSDGAVGRHQGDLEALYLLLSMFSKVLASTYRNY